MCNCTLVESSALVHGVKLLASYAGDYFGELLVELRITAGPTKCGVPRSSR